MMANFNYSFNNPQLVWVTEPETKIRFRYESEGGSHGGLAGKAGKKTYPTLKLENYNGRKKIIVKVSLYTEDRKPHVLEFKGKKNEGSKPYIQEFLEEDYTVAFNNIHILSKKKDVIESILMERKLSNLKEGMTRAARAQFEKTYTKNVKERARAILNSVRLYFEAFEVDRPNVPLCHLFSDVICNQKAASKGDLRICRLSSVNGSWKGGDEVILLCEKVQKETIKIKFFETDETGVVVWQEYAVFSPMDVHYQVAIAFKTPPYHRNEEKSVYICLERNEEVSEPREFTYKPDEPSSKKRKHEESDIASFPDTPDSIPSNEQPYFPPPTNFNVAPGAISSFPSDDWQENDMNGEMPIKLEDITNMAVELEDYNLPFENLLDQLVDFDDNSDAFDGKIPKCYHTSGPPLMMDRQYWMTDMYDQMTDYVDGPKITENYVNYVFDSVGIDVKNMTLKEVLDSVKNMTLKDNDECESKLPSYSVKMESKSPIKETDLQRKKKICSSFLLKRDSHGNTILHQAVLANKNMTPLLKMSRFVKIDLTTLKNHKNQTALHIAAEENRCEAVRILLKCGSNPNLKDSKGNNCYLVAALNNFPDVLREINRFSHFRHQASDFNDEGLTALHVAVVKKNPALFYSLEMHMTDPNIAEKKAGKSLLHYAVDFNSLIVPELLKIRNINVNVQDFEGNTPLHIACASANVEVVKKLLQSGADPSIKNFKENILEENSEDENTNGQLPADLTTNLEILQLLRCATKEVIDGSIVEEVDIFQEMPCQITEELSKYLDQDEKWKKLAPFFLDEDVMNSLSLSSSPSKALMSFVKKQEEGDFLERLKTALEFADLTGGVSIINRHLAV